MSNELRFVTSTIWYGLVGFLLGGAARGLAHAFEQGLAAVVMWLISVASATFIFLFVTYPIMPESIKEWFE